ncbi:MAG: ParB/RepB/Spo0J family partition protein [Pseudomonadaceae bacterium]|nr:ParB/RepB/Spo0J family partition protein [Pseudomonadaceae bacterium]
MTIAVTEIPLRNLQPSPTNPRKHLTGIEELAESIKQVGIQQPLGVRKLKGAKHEIIFGERRYTAAKMAGLKSAPCIVREYDDDQVLEIQIIENLQREDVHPLDEADGLKVLVDRGRSIAEISERIGRPTAHVAKRLRLTILAPAARKALDDETLTLGAAVELSKLPTSELQETALSELSGRHYWGDNVVREAKVKEYVNDHYLLRLRAIPWKMDDAQLVPEAGACNVCPKRSSAQSELFDTTSKTDLCLDRACFRGKLVAIWVNMKAAGEGKFVEGDAAEDAIDQRYTSSYITLDDVEWVDHKRVKVSTLIKGSDVEIYHLQHPETFEIKKAVTKSALANVLVEKHPESPAANRLSSSSTTAQGKAARKKELEKQRQEKMVQERVIRKAVTLLTDSEFDMFHAMGTYIIGRMESDVAKRVIKSAGLDEVTYKPYMSDKPALDVRATLEKAFKELDAEVLHTLIFELLLTAAAAGNYSNGSELWKTAPKQLGVDVAAIKKEVAAERKKALTKKPKTPPKKRVRKPAGGSS